MKLIFASHNRNKLKEVQNKIDEKIELLSLTDINFFEDILESGDTFKENAKIKAETISTFSGLNCFADDSGLIVEYLNGQPGVYSARYAGDKASDTENIDLLLHNLTGANNRNAFFKTVICLIYNQQKYYFEGELHGTIGLKPVGENGFGYDPIFIPQGSEKTLAEMSLTEKNLISHRAKALSSLTTFLKSIHS